MDLELRRAPMSERARGMSKAQKRAKWRLGELDYLLYEYQMPILLDFLSSKENKIIMKISRRWGKSFIMALIAYMVCTSKSHAVVNYIAPTAGQVEKIVLPNFRKIAADAPPDLRPKVLTSKNQVVFPNGSIIYFVGAGVVSTENLRGPASDLNILDEAAFFPNLKYIYKSVLFPQTSDSMGKTLFASTPHPLKHNTDFENTYCKEAERKGKLHVYTLDDNKRFNQVQKQRIIDEMGGPHDPELLVEYYCIVPRNDEIMVIPELNEKLLKEVVVEVDRPDHFDVYVSADWGGDHWTFLLFAYYDYLADTLVVEDELVYKKDPLPSQIAADLEKRLFVLYDGRPPYRMICDNNNRILTNDLNSTYGLRFSPTRKDNKIAQVNTLRQMFSEQNIFIHPRCKYTINHAKYAKWVKDRMGNKKKFALDSDGSHFDGLDALIYMTRNLVRNRNPYPAKQIPKGRIVFNRHKPTQYEHLAQTMGFKKPRRHS